MATRQMVEELKKLPSSFRTRLAVREVCRELLQKAEAESLPVRQRVCEYVLISLESTHVTPRQRAAAAELRAYTAAIWNL